MYMYFHNFDHFNMEWSQETCLKLIDLYRSFEILWNPKNQSYYNNIKKEDAWNDISKETEKSIDECKKKIESLKGSYRREKSKVKRSKRTGEGRDQIYKSRWFGFHAMKFLDDKTKSTNTVSNTDLDESSLHEEEDFEVPEKTEEYKNEKFAKKPSIKRKYKEDPIHQAFKYETTEDECASFGEYIGNKIRKLDDRHRALAQYKINNILFELEMSLYTGNSENIFSIPTHTTTTFNPTHDSKSIISHASSTPCPLLYYSPTHPPLSHSPSPSSDFSETEKPKQMDKL